MDFATLGAITGEFTRNIKNTRIVFLNEKDAMLLGMNNGNIPVFENDGHLDSVTEKQISGSRYDAVRPYFVCYNKVLGADVLYPMTASQTEDSIREGKRYEQIVTPQNIYGFIDSSVSGEFNQDTHTDSNISTVDISRGLPIFGQILDNARVNHIDYPNAEFSSSALGEVREFMDKFYTKEAKLDVVQAVQSGASQRWFIEKTKRLGKSDTYSHQFYRPATAYLALFINWAESELKDGTMSDIPMLERLGELYKLATAGYINLLKHNDEVEAFKKSHARTYRIYAEEKTFVFADSPNVNFDIGMLRERLDYWNMNSGDRSALDTLIKNERALESRVGSICNAIIMFMGESSRHNMSTIKADEQLFDRIITLSKSKRFDEDMQVWNAEVDKLVQVRSVEIINERQELEQKRFAEHERRRKVKLEAERLESSKSTSAEENAKLAIKLYNEVYNDAITRAIKGELYKAEQINDKELIDVAQNFLKIFSILSEREDFSEMEESASSESVGSEFGRRAISMRSFVPNVQEALMHIAESPRARQLQSYLTRESKTIGGDDITIQGAIDLIKLVHDEYSKTRNISKNGAVESEQTPERVIVEKVVNQKARFAEVDLTEGSRARSFLDEAISVIENQDYLYNILGIFTMNRIALSGMKDARSNEEKLQPALQSFLGKVSESWSMLFSSAFKSMADVDSALKILYDKYNSVINARDKSIAESIDELNKIRMNFNVECNWLINRLGELERNVQTISENLESRKERIAVWLSQLGAKADEVKKKNGVPLNEGLMENCGEILVCHKNPEPDSFETVKRKITDKELLEEIYRKYMYPTAVYLEQMFDAIDNADGLLGLFKFFNGFAQESQTWEEQDKRDFKAVIEVYDKLLVSTFGHIDRVVGERRNITREFISKINILSNIDGKPLIEEGLLRKIQEACYESIEQIRENSREECYDSLKDYAKLFYNYVVKLPEHKGDTTIRDKYFGNDLVSYSLDTRGINEPTAKLRRAMDGGFYIKDCLRDEEIYKQFSYLAVMLYLTIKYEAVRATVGEGNLVAKTSSSYQKLAEAREFTEALAGMDKETGFQATDGLYRYCVGLLHQLDGFQKHYVGSETPLNAVKEDSFSNACKSLRLHILCYIHEMEGHRRAEGEELLTEGRDVEKEKKLLLANLVGDRDSILAHFKY